MNRSQRRNAQRQGLPVAKDPIITMKRSDIQRIKQEATDKATETAMILMLAIPVKVMYDKYGWRMKKRLPELAEALTDEYERFSEGEMTLEEYQNLVFDYCGIKFQKNEEE